ncbi:hypothetical protein GCM10025865_18230 [Paraoerskovia sediminicola]|uniref:DNA-directed DNA polymerase n=1 Tax=Paraoerskovia sediminicola TaxID=1138587 RepID=A0ABN6XCD1_9CELL|nr:DNA polymerase III subunit gamma and tau [Paraoerskovia sediminicola]BDZ42524.1 hypothetical protein GCM10025865_18230 [Paraoerskovia sediminicola]
MSTALYRRYRPDDFSEVIGQQHVTGPLMQALKSERITHAYLFSGPRGCGKTTSARILARCLNCAQGPTPTPCGECDSCVELARGGSGSLDVVEIDAASHGGVDDARDLRERATFAPTRDRYKIFILDEAHMVTPSGFNALLKIVEEPPPHIKFIFATTEPDKVIGTIRSRTHHYPFRLVPPDVLGPYLDELCAAEGVAIGSGVVPLVVRAGGGSVRDSLSVMDQLIAGAEDGTVDYDRATALLGFTHAALLDEVVDAVAAGDGGAMFRVVDRIVSTGHEPRRFVEDLLERLRDLVVIAVSGDSADAVFRDLPTDQLDRMRTQAQGLGVAELSRAADLVNAALTEMVGATSPRLHLELMCARLLVPGGAAGGGLVARVERLERGGAAPADRGVTAGAESAGRAGAGAGPAGVGAGRAEGQDVGSGAGDRPRVRVADVPEARDHRRRDPAAAARGADAVRAALGRKERAPAAEAEPVPERAAASAPASAPVPEPVPAVREPGPAEREPGPAEREPAPEPQTMAPEPERQAATPEPELDNTAASAEAEPQAVNPDPEAEDREIATESAVPGPEPQTEAAEPDPEPAPGPEPQTQAAEPDPEPAPGPEPQPETEPEAPEPDEPSEPSAPHQAAQIVADDLKAALRSGWNRFGQGVSGRAPEVAALLGGLSYEFGDNRLVLVFGDHGRLRSFTELDGAAVVAASASEVVGAPVEVEARPDGDLPVTDGRQGSGAGRRPRPAVQPAVRPAARPAVRPALRPAARPAAPMRAAARSPRPRAARGPAPRARTARDLVPQRVRQPHRPTRTRRTRRGSQEPRRSSLRSRTTARPKRPAPPHLQGTTHPCGSAASRAQPPMRRSTAQTRRMCRPPTRPRCRPPCRPARHGSPRRRRPSPTPVATPAPPGRTRRHRRAGPRWTWCPTTSPTTTPTWPRRAWWASRWSCRCSVER